MSIDKHSTDKHSIFLKEAKEAALLARQVLLNYFGNLSRVEEKKLAGLVSEADKTAEKVVQEHLWKKFPDFGFLGEEGSFDNPELLSSLRSKEGLWIVDPLDGTTNYVHGFHVFCCSIALMYKGDVVVGVVDVPVLDETYWAQKNAGAFVNDRPLKVSSTERLHDSLLATGFNHEDEPTLAEQLKVFSDLIRRCRGVRRAGAAAYDLCLTARGIFDVYWERNLKPWDAAAGALLVREAGGVVKTYRGLEYNPFHNSLVAGNKTVLNETMPHIQKHICTDAD